MKIHEFVYYANKIDSHSDDTDKIAYLAEAFNNAGPDLNIAALFFKGQLFPSWDERKVEIGNALMYKVIAEASGKDESDIESIAAKIGDSGEVCEKVSLSQEVGQQTLFSNSLTLSDISETFEEIAEMSGSGSQARKIQAMSQVILQLKDGTISTEDGDVTVTVAEQAKYLVRLVLGEMRIGVGDGMVRDSIAEAFDVDTDEVQQALMNSADAGETAVTARDPDKSLSDLDMVVGRPIELMLATTGDIEEAMSDWGDVIAEYKYDGVRLAIHKDGDDVWLYTRGLEDVTDSLPDVVDIVQENVNADTAIIDSEVVAYESEEDDEPLPFQEIMKRIGRKYDVEEKTAEISLNIHSFDVLYAEGESLLNKSNESRFERLTQIADDSIVTKHIHSDSVRDIQDFEAKALSSGNEGIMLKKPDAVYSPGKRGRDWRKIKPSVETLDCVVIGGEWGQGRRANIPNGDGEEIQTIGSYRLGVLDKNGTPQSVGKVASGMTDEQLLMLLDKFKPLIKEENGADITFENDVVFEVGFEEIQPSPDEESGYGLRFPRFLGVREDKRVSDVDTVERLERIYDKQ